MGRFTDMAEHFVEGLKDRVLDGHRIRRIIWETDSAVVFQDEQGRFWRYLHAYRKAWPVVVEDGE